MSAAAETEVEKVDPKLQEQMLKVGSLMHTLSRDPKHRRKVLELLKEADPDTVIPELDIEVAADKRAAEQVKPLTEKMASLFDDVASLKATLARERWSASTGLDDDELTEVEKLAKEKGITKADTAVEYYRAVGAPRGTRRNKIADEYLGELGKVNPRNTSKLKALAIAQANRVVTEMRGRRMAG